MGRRARNKQSDPEPLAARGDNQASIRKSSKRRAEDADLGHSHKKLKPSPNSRDGNGKLRPSRETGKKSRKKDSGFDKSEEGVAASNREDDGDLEAHRKLVPQATDYCCVLIPLLTGFCLMPMMKRLRLGRRPRKKPMAVVITKQAITETSTEMTGSTCLFCASTLSELKYALIFSDHSSVGRMKLSHYIN